MRASTAMAPQLLGRLIGLILGDGYIGRTRPTWNAIFPFQLSLKRFPYFWQVFSLLCHFCQSFAWYAKEQPYIPRGFSPYHTKPHAKTSFSCYGDNIRFRTRAYPFIHDYLRSHKCKWCKASTFSTCLGLSS